MKNFIFLLLPLLAAAPVALHAQTAGDAVFNCMVSGRDGTIAGADVILIGLGNVSGMRHRLQTDADGSVELTATAGTYLLTVGKPGFVPVVDEVELITGRAVMRIFRLETNVDAVLDPVQTTASRESQSVSDAPATTYVVTAQQIRKRGYLYLQDVLNDLPEIFVQRYVNPETQDLISSRGVLGNEKFLLLQDEIQISSASGDPNSIGGNYPVTSAKQVEVILGPASALYGADAFAGVINIITDDGDETPLNVRATVAYGRFNTNDYALSLNARAGRVRFFANGSLYTSSEPPFWELYPDEFGWYANGTAPDTFDNIGVGAAPSRLPDSISREYETPSLAYTIHGGLRWQGFELGVSYRLSEHSSSWGDRPQWSVYEERAELDNINRSIYLKHTLRAKSKKWELTSILFNNMNGLVDEDGTSAFINTFSNYTIAYKYNRAVSNRIMEQLNASLSETLKLSLGGQFEQLNAIPLTADLPQPYDRSLAPEDQQLYYPGTTVEIPFFTLSYLNYGFYGQLQYAAANKAFDLLLGGRYDHSTRYGGYASPRLGLTWRPLAQRDKLNFKLMYGEGFLNPAPWKAFVNYGPVFEDATGAVVSPFYHMPNPELKPEKLRSLEASANYRPAKNVLVAADAFVNMTTDRILVNGGTATTASEVIPVDRFEGINFTDVIEIPDNVGVSLAYGGTLRSSALLAVGSAAKVELFAAITLMEGGYTFSDSIPLGDILLRSHETDGVFDLGNTPHFSAKGGATLGWKTASASLRFQYIGSMRGEVVSNGDQNDDHFGENSLGEPYYSPAYWVANAFVRNQIWSNDRMSLAVWGRINNLLDARYYNVYYGGVRGLPRVPQDQLRWTVGATFEF